VNLRTANKTGTGSRLVVQETKTFADSEGACPAFVRASKRNEVDIREKLWIDPPEERKC
jgi:hypothetical protein